MDGSRGIFRLGRGVTGFRSRDDLPLPDIDPKECRSAWHAAARSADGDVGDFTEREYPQGFHVATINDRHGTHIALFHAHYPLVAFVRDKLYVYRTEFLDPPAWATTLGGFGFVVLTAADLLSPLGEADGSALSQAEWRQIKHWRPETLGAALFNSWD
ncbi:hypothetical protein AQF52_7819 [Streptomyces venezuelae]|uniref:hypothetical protein n=1 Tax=Streptomyces gardneri TaxID=66892 RepID=UPI0006BD45D4|nr:hypothetical protein [Streptomyces gardneri]ALO13405.1 hypothetical protein AQF52_7819 [Streptomyces venezuelae]QPK50041.1 hypothetical protein H4W23_39225 [Streptomyces gardneri]WRK41622.1 hypothetical protein U0M97_39465 [Streptomyces venezuelae]CUM35881.1 hypothetical protein BN2537_727 [Streptomyces venezuelae]